MRSQSAAIPFRRGEDGEIELLLVTSRLSQRWILPKGTVKPGAPAHLCASEEAYEEAGVIGNVTETSVCTYRQSRAQKRKRAKVARVEAFPLAVMLELPAWPEMQERERRWVPVEEAMRLTNDGEIRKAIRLFQKRFLLSGNLRAYHHGSS